MNILSIGPMEGVSNTCRLRTAALKKIAEYVDVISTNKNKTSFLFKCSFHLFQLGIPIELPENCGENKRILNAVKNKEYDIIWIDKGITIYPETLKEIKRIQPQSVLVSYSPDNMALRHNQSQNYLKSIPLYDIHFTTKSYIIDELTRLGAKKVIFTNQSYDEDFHYPREITDDDLKRIGGEVGFVGTWEEARMNSLLYLSRKGIPVRVFGTKEWQQCKNDNPNLIIENHGLYNDDYAKSFRCFKISLCFLRKMNLDQQTSRTMEIPACGGFMLAERTNEHLNLFTENKEAVYFSSDEELYQKCLYYLTHDDERQNIAEAGHNRAVMSGYSNVETLRQLIETSLNRGKL